MSTVVGGPPPGARSGPALVSIASNTLLILLKLVAGAVTGSVAILTEAIHSGVDLIASIVTYLSVRTAEEPADASHRYGHEKYENAAAGVEGLLILVGSAVIVVEAVRHLVAGSEVDSLGFGIGVIAFSAVCNLGVSTWLHRRARETESPALEGDAAHLRTDSMTSFGVLGGLVLVSVTGESWIDPIVAILIAIVIVVSGVRIMRRAWGVLVDAALPTDEVAAIRACLASYEGRDVVGYHQLRTRRAGARRYVDLHLQFAAGTSLERAHSTAHLLQDRIARRLGNADVLIHLEPADRVREAGDHGELAPPRRPS